jgi:hypothetical protein
VDACWGLARINQKGKVSGKPEDLSFKYTYDATEETGKDVNVYIVGAFRPLVQYLQPHV